MTVSTALNKIIYSGNGGTTSFPFTFAVPAVPSDIQVFFTDINGNVTLLTNGPSSAQYQLTINAPVAPDPTPVGGTVTYNPLGVPIPIGTFLTILRTLPLVQATSLTNQGTLYQQVTEQALDYQMMTSQQVLEIQSRALVVNVSDPTPNPLPAVASRANQVLGFDSFGNPIAVSTLPAGTVSSAMAPVVNAASLATARSLLGLGNVAVETIGLGLQDNGSGSLQTFFGEVSDSTSQSVTSAFHQRIRSATGAITYTFPLSSTLFNGFGFWVYAQTAAVTFTPNAADMFNGGTTGQSLIIPPGTRCFVSTDAAGNWYIRGYNPDSLGVPKNASISVTLASNAMTITLLDGNGNAPSPASPVLFSVPTATGGIVPRAVTGPLSVTIPSGATVGTVSGVASRLWVHLFDNAGTPVLGVYNCLTNSNPSFSLAPWDQTTAQTSTAISAGSTSSGVYYTASGVTSKFFTPLGYVESTQATAGTWVTTPTKVQLFGAAVARPGTYVQKQVATSTSQPSITSATFAPFTGITVAITPISFCNLIEVAAHGAVNVTNSGSAFSAAVQLSRGTTAATNMIGSMNGQVTTAQSLPSINAALLAYDLPGAAATYAVQGKSPQALQWNGVTSGQSVMQATEIQI